MKSKNDRVLKVDNRSLRVVSQPACVRCGCTDIKRNGKFRKKQRWLCRGCGRTFSGRSGTILLSSKLPTRKLNRMISLILDGVLVRQVADQAGVSRRTVMLWKRKLQMLPKSQEETRLSGTVHIDYTYVRDEGNEETKRGISKNLLRIAVARDSNGNCLAAVSGNGKAKDWEMVRDFAKRIEPDSVVRHDLEFTGIRFRGCLSVPVRAGTPTAHRLLNPVDRMCAAVKRMLAVHSGIRIHNLQRWLDELAEKISLNATEDFAHYRSEMHGRIFTSGKTLTRRQVRDL